MFFGTQREHRNGTSYRKILSAGVIALLVITAGGIATASGASAKKGASVAPQPPQIVSIQSKTSKDKRRADLIITIALSSNVPTKSITLSEVFAGKQKCVIKKAKTSCTIRNVEAEYTRHSISARTKANNKFSKSSKKIKFTVNRMNRKWSNPAFRPAPRVNRNLAAVLGSAGGKVTNMQGVRRGVRTSSLSAMRAGSMSTSTARYTLNVNGAVAFAQFESSFGSDSGLYAISATGAISDAFTENWTEELPPGQPPLPYNMARVSKFFIAPNGQMYVQFVNQIRMTSEAALCMFFSFATDTGIPTCVDASLSGMHWYGGWGAQRYTNPGVQFDATGNVYYLGHSFTMGQGGAVLRKLNVATGAISNLITENTAIQDFAVLADGSVIIVGGTSSTASQWTRVVSASGVLRNIGGQLSTVAASFVAKFEDGNFYLGVWNPMGQNAANGVLRLVPSSGTLDSKYWIRTMMWNDNGNQSPGSYNDAGYNEVCINAEGILNYSDQFCQWGGSQVSRVVTANGKNYALTGGMGPQVNASLMQYFPTLKKVPSTISRVTLVESTGTKLIITGTNSDGANVLSVYDPATDIETLVMDGSNEIEVYSMTYVPVLNKVMFSGLQFATNSYVVGEIAIS
jgi:hypothetical protein